MGYKYNVITPSKGCITFTGTSPPVLINAMYPQQGCHNESISSGAEYSTRDCILHVRQIAGSMALNNCPQGGIISNIKGI